MTEKYKSKKENDLKNEEKQLINLAKILNSFNVDFYLGSGALLGLVRDGHFIEWDWDVGIYLKVEEIYPIRHEVIEKLIRDGYQLIKFDCSINNFKIVVMYSNIKFELFGFYKKNHYRFRRIFKIPDRFFNNNNFLNIINEAIPVLGPPDEFLDYYYKSWKTPIKSTRTKDIINKRARRRNIIDRVKFIIYL
jgi:hypothetical protein